MSLAKFQGIVVTLMVLGILVGAGLLALTSFRDSIGDSACSSRSDAFTTYVAPNYCSNGSHTIQPSVSLNGTDNWATASTNLSSKAPTAGTLFGIGLIIVAVFGGIFYFMGRGRAV